MAGAVRQPIDVASLSSYIAQRVPDIQLPISVKQVHPDVLVTIEDLLTPNVVWLWTIESYLSAYGSRRKEICAAEETSWQASLKDSAPHRSRIPHHTCPRGYRCACAENVLPVRGCGGDRLSLLHHGISGWTDLRECGIPRRHCRREDGDVSWLSYLCVCLLTQHRWHDAVRTLAKLHRIAPSSINMESFGKPSAFYNRQIKTFSTISASQAQAVDVETKVAVGKIPHYDDTVAFLQDPRTQPQDRGTLVHGDYKIDNLVYHRIEPMVIGIIE